MSHGARTISTAPANAPASVRSDRTLRAAGAADPRQPVGQDRGESDVEPVVVPDEERRGRHAPEHEAAARARAFQVAPGEPHRRREADQLRVVIRRGVAQDYEDDREHRE